MKANLNDFISYLNDQIGQPYVWGAQGTKLTMTNYVSIIDRREEKESNRKAAKKYCKKLFDSGKKELRAYDCSGLGMYYLENLHHIYDYDMSANSLLAKCEPASVAKRGYFVFHHNGKKATHIGYMVSDTEVIHAKGRSYGVVRERFKSGSQWNRIGKPKCIDFEQPEPERYIFMRELKYGDSGQDVIEMKKLLIEKGFGKNITIDKPSSRNFRGETRRRVKEYQKSVNIKADGVAGHDTLVSLGGVWLGE